jgi:hypothetical protein
VKNAVFSDVTPCGLCKNGRLGRSYRFHHQGDKNQRDRNNFSGNQQPKHKWQAIRSSETSALTTATRRNISEDGILHNCRRETHKCYTDGTASDNARRRAFSTTLTVLILGFCYHTRRPEMVIMNLIYLQLCHSVQNLLFSRLLSKM